MPENGKLEKWTKLFLMIRLEELFSSTPQKFLDVDLEFIKIQNLPLLQPVLIWSWMLSEMSFIPESLLTKGNQSGNSVIGIKTLFFVKVNI